MVGRSGKLEGEAKRVGSLGRGHRSAVGELVQVELDVMHADEDA